MTKPKILILTDSVALPRSYAQGSVPYEDTYIYKLRGKYSHYEIINVSFGGASIKDLVTQVNYYAILEPEIVILQCGIVDCAPRAFGRIEMELIKKMKLFRVTKYFFKFLRKYRGHNYVNKKNYEKHLIYLKDKLKPEKFYSLGIIPSNSSYEKKAPGITKNIENYNIILKKHTLFIDLSCIPREAILPDFHHINEIGHTYVLEKLLDVVNAKK